ncbi:MAG: hypothetical protein ABSG53_09070 [Thermoguttaceae bacterium]
MSVADPQPTVPRSSIRWFHPTPGRFVLLLLAVEVLLWLSDRFGRPGWHKGYAVLTAVASVGVGMLAMLVWFGVALVFRRRFQFRIRSLLVLAVVVAVPCSWLTMEMRDAKRERVAATAIQEFAEYRTVEWSEPSEPAWLRTLLGDDLFRHVERVTVFDTRSGLRITNTGLEQLESLKQLRSFQFCSIQFTDAGLAHIKGLKQLHEVDIQGTQITDAGLEHLKGLTQLQMLLLTHTKVTSAGLAHIKRLSRMQILYLQETQITDVGLVNLKGLSQLQRLDLADTCVTDAGLDYLKGLSQLMWLRVSATRVTDEGVRKLQEALPNCKITR